MELIITLLLIANATIMIYLQYRNSVMLESKINDIEDKQNLFISEFNLNLLSIQNLVDNFNDFKVRALELHLDSVKAVIDKQTNTQIVITKQLEELVANISNICKYSDTKENCNDCNGMSNIDNVPKSLNKRTPKK